MESSQLAYNFLHHSKSGYKSLYLYFLLIPVSHHFIIFGVFVDKFRMNSFLKNFGSLSSTSLRQKFTFVTSFNIIFKTVLCFHLLRPNVML